MSNIWHHTLYLGFPREIFELLIGSPKLGNKYFLNHLWLKNFAINPNPDIIWYMELASVPQNRFKSSVTISLFPIGAPVKIW